MIEAISALDKLKIEMDRAVKLYTKSIDRQKQQKQLSTIVKEYISNKNIMRKLVNISGKQRMLTQRVTKLTIQCVLKLRGGESCKDTQRYVKEYEKALITFVKGNEKTWSPSKKNREALIQIKRLYLSGGPFAKRFSKSCKNRR